MKVKYFNADGTEQIVDAREDKSGALVLPPDLVIPCGCTHDPVNPKGSAWPAAVFCMVLVVGLVAVAWKLLDVISG